MNLYKFNFDLGGSANTEQYITVPADSKYSVGVKITKNGRPVDGGVVMLEDDLYQYDPKEIFNGYSVFAGQTGAAGTAKTYTVKYHKDGTADVAGVNATFKGVTVKTNDSAISQWAVTDSQFKIVYTDEWPELSSAADPSTVYIVATRPPAPRPIPVPPAPGDNKWAIRVLGFELNDPPEDYVINPDDPAMVTSYSCAAYKDCEQTTENGDKIYVEYAPVNQQQIGDNYAKCDYDLVYLEGAQINEDFTVSYYSDEEFGQHAIFVKTLLVSPDGTKLIEVVAMKNFNSPDEALQEFTRLETGRILPNFTSDGYEFINIEDEGGTLPPYDEWGTIENGRSYEVRHDEYALFTKIIDLNQNRAPAYCYSTPQPELL